MGLFDKLVKGVAKEVLEGAKDAIEKHTGIDIDGSDNETTSSNEPVITMEVETWDGGLHTKEDFLEIVNEEFGDYTIETAVSPTVFGGIGRAYDIAIYKGTKLEVVIALVEHNKANKAYHDSKASAEKANVPFVNYYLHMRNEPDYVVDRIRKAIAK